MNFFPLSGENTGNKFLTGSQERTVSYEKSCIGNKYSGTVNLGAKLSVYTVVFLLQGKYIAKKILLKGR